MFPTNGKVVNKSNLLTNVGLSPLNCALRVVFGVVALATVLKQKGLQKRAFRANLKLE